MVMHCFNKDPAGLERLSKALTLDKQLVFRMYARQAAATIHHVNNTRCSSYSMPPTLNLAIPVGEEHCRVPSIRPDINNHCVAWL